MKDYFIYQGIFLKLSFGHPPRIVFCIVESGDELQCDLQCPDDQTGYLLNLQLLDDKHILTISLYFNNNVLLIQV